MSLLKSPITLNKTGLFNVSLLSVALISSLSAFADPRRGAPGRDGVPVIVVPPGNYWEHHPVPVRPNPPGRPNLPRRPIYTPPARSGEENEQVAADMVARNMMGLGCERMGDALRRLSNQILSTAQQSRNTAPPAPGDEAARQRFEERARFTRVSRTPAFWKKVWNRVADAYRGCNLECFDDGVAVGQISASTYCSASIAIGGFDSPGFLPQPPLPLCQSAIFAGCQSGYQTSAASVEGCSAYTSGRFDSIFKASISQDCHID